MLSNSSIFATPFHLRSNGYTIVASSSTLFFTLPNQMTRPSTKELGILLSNWDDSLPGLGFDTNVEKDLIRDLILRLVNMRGGKLSQHSMACSLHCLCHQSSQRIRRQSCGGSTAGIIRVICFCTANVRVPLEFSWANSFSDLEWTISAKLTQ